MLIPPFLFVGWGVARPVGPVSGERVDIAAVHRHDVHGVVPKLEGALRTRRAEVHTERKDLAVPDQACGLRNLVRGDEVQGPQLVIASPPSPVGDVAGGPSEVGHASHEARPSSSPRAMAAPTFPPSTHTTWPEI